jgi:hypothetical protein
MEYIGIVGNIGSKDTAIESDGEPDEAGRNGT